MFRTLEEARTNCFPDHPWFLRTDKAIHSKPNENCTARRKCGNIRNKPFRTTENNFLLFSRRKSVFVCSRSFIYFWTKCFFSSISTVLYWNAILGMFIPRVSWLYGVIIERKCLNLSHYVTRFLRSQDQEISWYTYFKIGWVWKFSPNNLLTEKMRRLFAKKIQWPARGCAKFIAK